MRRTDHINTTCLTRKAIDWSACVQRLRLHHNWSITSHRRRLPTAGVGKIKLFEPTRVAPHDMTFNLSRKIIISSVAPSPYNKNRVPLVSLKFCSTPGTSRIDPSWILCCKKEVSSPSCSHRNHCGKRKRFDAQCLGSMMAGVLFFLKSIHSHVPQQKYSSVQREEYDSSSSTVPA